MATTTGKKARRAGGSRFACKRMKAKTGKRRTWGHLPYSASAKNVGEALAANDKLVGQTAAARRAKGHDFDANVAVSNDELTQSGTRRARSAEQVAA